MVDPRSADSQDVKFLIGPEKREFQANKFGLAYHSAVFHRMFFTDFPSEKTILVPDVDASAFEVMLNGIAGREVLLNDENAAAVYYVAEKYDLQLLRQMCKTFVLNSVDATNALVLLNSFHRYNVSEINKECLSLILDDPVQFFQEPEFLDAPIDVIRSIFKARLINCSLGDLQDALSAWMTKQGLKYRGSKWFEDVEKHLRLSRGQLESKKVRQNLYRKIDFSFTDKRSLEISESIESLEGPVYLYGLGLVMGKVPKETIEIEISTDKVSYDFKNTVVKEGLSDKVSIQDVFFDKKLIYGVKLVVKVTFDGEEVQRACVQYKKQDSFVSYLILTSLLGTPMCDDCESRQQASL